MHIYYALVHVSMLAKAWYVYLYDVLYAYVMVWSNSTIPKRRDEQKLRLGQSTHAQ